MGAAVLSRFASRGAALFLALLLLGSGGLCGQTPPDSPPPPVEEVKPASTPDSPVEPAEPAGPIVTAVEVRSDAPLDESNIGRFTELLRKFVKDSQFIIITHNKRTVAAANGSSRMPLKAAARFTSQIALVWPPR